MSYQKHEWKKGDAITAERLNNIEEGIAEKASSESTTVPSNSTNNSSKETETFIVNGTFGEEQSNGTEILFNKTIKEIYDAANANKIVLLKLINEVTILIPLVRFSFAESYELIFSTRFDETDISVKVISSDAENSNSGILRSI